jgi:hypothetical protein
MLPSSLQSLTTLSAAAAAGKCQVVKMNARDNETFCLVQEMIGSSRSSSSSDLMQEDKEEEAVPHAPKEWHTGQWTKPMLADRLKRQKFSRAQDDHVIARELDARAQECTAEEGLLLPSLLAQLKQEALCGDPHCPMGTVPWVLVWRTGSPAYGYFCGIC